MVVIETPSGRMSVRPENVPPGAVIVSPFNGGGGGGGASSPPPQAPPPPTVTIEGNTVFVNGQGFSVRPQDQAAFIQQQTGGEGGSAQQAIQQARQTAIQQEAARQTASPITIETTIIKLVITKIITLNKTKNS